jgi:hypothetical protein
MNNVQKHNISITVQPSQILDLICSSVCSSYVGWSGIWDQPSGNWTHIFSSKGAPFDTIVNDFQQPALPSLLKC